MTKTTGGNALLDANFVLNKINIEERQKIADLGCGAAGHYIFKASSLVGKNGKVYAVDILKSVLEGVKRRTEVENIKNIETVWSDLEIFGATKIEAGSLDVALLINTLYQSRKRVEIIREAGRMLKKGGVLMIVEWARVAITFGPPVKERVKLDLLIDGSKKLGFKLENKFDASKYHYGVIFKKI